MLVVKIMIINFEQKESSYFKEKRSKFRDNKSEKKEGGDLNRILEWVRKKKGEEGENIPKSPAL